MNQKSNRSIPEEEALRNLIQTMSVPIDRERLKRRFRNKAEESFAARSPRVKSWVFRLAWCGGVSYGVFLCIYVWMVLSNSPIQRIESQQYSLRTVFQSALGKTVHYSKGDKIVLCDGSLLSCLRDSTVGVIYTFKERLIEFHQGTIEITAAPNSSLPMSVISGETQICVVGTRFVVSTEGSIWDGEDAP